ncbi:MAG TPA: hypothetical protein VHQ86_02095, partial [Candidatus Saccharimonadia bacterium]|nr:hypothetical protein [Candidatus Saccharimonadia bacterium]
MHRFVRRVLAGVLLWILGLLPGFCPDRNPGEQVRWVIATLIGLAGAILTIIGLVFYVFHLVLVVPGLALLIIYYFVHPKQREERPRRD